MTGKSKKALLIVISISVIIIIVVVILSNTLCRIPITLDAAEVDKIEIYDTFGDIPTITLSTPEDDYVIKEIVKLYNKSDDYRDDVGTTHPIRIHMTMHDDTYLSMWYGTQRFITVSNGNIQFNMQNIKLENYINQLLEDVN